MENNQNNAPQVQIAKGVVAIEPDTQALDTYLDAVESRLERLGQKAAAAFAPPEFVDPRRDDHPRDPAPEFVETGPARQGENGVTATPVQFTSTQEQEISRIAESVQRCEQYLAVIAGLLAEGRE